ncbi:MAG: NAD-dependent epimerase/dehydratase family protein, partial [Methyloligellaceae bacterium]
YDVLGLVRSEARADQVRALGIEPVLGSLADEPVLADAAGRADAVINAANAEDRGSAEALLRALAGTGKPFIQTSGSSIVADLAAGKAGDKVYDEETPVDPLPGRAGRVAINDMVRAAAETGVRTAIICPTLIYGRGRGLNPNSIQVPWLIDLARKHGSARHIGPGENIWSNVHIDDLVDLYVLALSKAPAGAFYYAENGENAMREVCEAINTALGFGEAPASITIEEAAAEWGEGAANYTMGSNSRVRAVRARSELGWAPHRPSLLEDILAASPG